MIALWLFSMIMSIVTTHNELGAQTQAGFTSIKNNVTLPAQRNCPADQSFFHSL